MCGVQLFRLEFEKSKAYPSYFLKILKFFLNLAIFSEKLGPFFIFLRFCKILHDLCIFIRFANFQKIKKKYQKK